MLTDLWSSTNTKIGLSLSLPLLCLSAVVHHLYGVYFDLVLSRYYFLAHVQEKPYFFCESDRDDPRSSLRVLTVEGLQEEIYLPPFFRFQGRSLENPVCFVLHAHSDGMIPGSIDLSSPYGNIHWSLSYGGFLRMKSDVFRDRW